MNAAGLFSAISLAALATYLTRFPPLLLGRSLSLPPRIRKGLRHIPIGVFAALAAPSIFLHRAVHGQPDYAFWGASIVALVIAWRTKSPLWTLVAGTVAAAGLRLVLPGNMG